MKFEDMSDYEINKAVAELFLDLVVDESKSRGRLESDIWLTDLNGVLKYTNYNPCNNPLDAWPIITKNYISIELDEYCLSEAYCLSSFTTESDDRISHVDENPLRAAMICFLMKEANQ